jgi:hypothetical protein
MATVGPVVAVAVDLMKRGLRFLNLAQPKLRLLVRAGLP